MSSAYIDLNGLLSLELDTVRPLDDGDGVVALDFKVPKELDDDGEGILEIVLTKDDLDRISDVMWNK